MDVEKKETRGRPPIAKRVKRVNVTLSEDDYEALKDFSSLTHTPVATFIRGIVEQAMPDLKSLTEAALEAQRTGYLDRLHSKGAAMLAKHIEAAEDVQKGLFDEKK